MSKISVNEESLVSVADAIRSKSGKSEKLVFPDEFVEDIQNIKTGIIPTGTLDITENGTFDVREKAEVNVQVVAKPEKPYIDSGKIKSYSHFFSAECGSADISLLNNMITSNSKRFDYSFYKRKDITEIEIDVSNGEFFDYMFAECSNLTSVVFKNMLNMLSCTYIFYKATNIQKIENIGIRVASTSQWGFTDCTKLSDVTFTSVIIKSDGFSMSKSPLTKESLLSLLNALSDNTGLATTYKVQLGSANLAKLTQEEKEIAYNKNISLA
jgi:hypothetical protein